MIKLADGLSRFTTNPIGSGQHRFHANTFAVKRHVYQKFNSAISKEKSVLSKLKERLIDETDLDIIDTIRKEIVISEGKISTLEKELRTQYVKYGETSFKTIFVP